MKILKCPKCGSYGLSAGCKCGTTRISPKPQKYSPEDKYGKYRRKYKEMKEK
ncbi:MAG: RNA-protein complex protein Nop10 [Nanoarchaeota archaeon]|nr:RNA-protein complex protein Nop10 [Nanoarchaeota archaeon]